MPKRASLRPVETDRKSAKWMVNLPVRYSRSGRRERHFFDTKSMAQTFCDQIKTSVENYGSQAQILSPAQLEQASQAFEKLAEFKISLNAVVEEWISKRKLANASIPFEQLLDEFSRGGRRQRPRSMSYTQSINQIRKRLTCLHGRVVSEITPRDIEKAVEGMVPSVRNYTLKILSCAFNVGISRGYMTENPVRKVELTHVTSGEIAVYTPPQVATMMSIAEETNQPLIPFLAISFFAGVRRSEILRMDWSYVHLDEQYIRLPKTITKTRQGRHIPIEPNLLKWLTPFVQSVGPIVPFSGDALRKRERALRAKHNIPCIKHGPRHCYGTYWLAMHGNIDRLMLSMGHTDFETTQQHYAKAATQKDARAFWEIEPLSDLAVRKIVQIVVEAA
jgi:integrase